MKNPFRIFTTTAGTPVRVNLLQITSYMPVKGIADQCLVDLGEDEGAYIFAMSLPDFEKVIEIYFGDLVTYATEI